MSIDYLYDYHELDNGNYIDDGTVLFQKDDRWRAARDGSFTRESFNTAEEIANAVGRGQVTWENPHAWKRTKAGGWYRRTFSGRIISVKQARSGAWFWTDGNDVHGWYNTADAARDGAHRNAGSY